MASSLRDTGTQGRPDAPGDLIAELPFTARVAALIHGKSVSGAPDEILAEYYDRTPEEIFAGEDRAQLGAESGDLARYFPGDRRRDSPRNRMLTRDRVPSRRGRLRRGHPCQDGGRRRVRQL
jgi:hypothetical protein